MKEDYEKAVNVISALQDNMKQNSSKFLTIAFVLAFASSALLQAEPASYIDSLWNAGVQAYSEQDYGAAAKAFTAISDASLSSPQLYTNIADSYYKSGDIARAVLWYSRALKIDPSYKDARFNLEFARARCQDRIESVPEFFLVSWNRNLCYGFSSNVWAISALILFALVLGMFLLFLLSRNRGARMTGFFAGLVALLLTAICFANALWQKNDFNMRDKAVVMSPVCSIKSTPSDFGGSDLFVLHEGTSVKLLDTVGSWCKISIADGREGWIRISDIEII